MSWSPLRLTVSPRPRLWILRSRRCVSRLGRSGNLLPGLVSSAQRRHLDLKHLWVQEAARAKRLVIVKEDGETNFADRMTKHLAEERMIALLTAAGFEFRVGRAPGALELIANQPGGDM